MSIVVVTGPTNWPVTVEAMMVVGDQMRRLPPGSVVIQGGAPGVDTISFHQAAGLPIYRVTVPYYGAGGRAGGPMRNLLMVQMAVGLWNERPGKDCFCLAFGTPGEDAGTDDCVRHAEKAGMGVRWVGRDEAGDPARRERFVQGERRTVGQKLRERGLA